MNEAIHTIRSQSAVFSLGLYPDQSSELNITDNDGNQAYLHLPCDCTMGSQTLHHGCWDLVKTHFATRSVSESDVPVAIIDVGASFGLFTRQMLAANPSVNTAFCYEPHPHSFKMLSYNLANIRDVRMTNCALGSGVEDLSLYVDRSNYGNCTTNQSFASDQAEVFPVKQISANTERNKWESCFPGGDFIFKSDTQGNDINIASSIALSFWGRVRCAFFELWPQALDDATAQSFFSILNLFTVIMPDSDHSKNFTASEALDWVLSASPGQELDLMCKK